MYATITMSSLGEQADSGLFYISSEPKAGHEEEYHEWYNTEHGPLRMKLDFVENGYRYRSTDAARPRFLAMYDLSTIAGLERPEYTKLREHRSPRERNVMDNMLTEVSRDIYKDISSRGTSDGPAPVIMTVTFVVKNEHVSELHEWYEQVSRIASRSIHTAHMARNTQQTSSEFLVGEGADVSS